jgi:hypothetical protein
VAVTVAVMVQLVPGTKVAPATGLIRMPTSPTLSAPPAESCNEAKGRVLAPVQTGATGNGAANVIAPGVMGNMSVKDTPVMLTGFTPGFAITMVRVAVPPEAIDSGANDFVIVGGAITFKTPEAATCGGVFEVVIGPVLLV